MKETYSAIILRISALFLLFALFGTGCENVDVDLPKEKSFILPGRYFLFRQSHSSAEILNAVPENIVSLWWSEKVIVAEVHPVIEAEVHQVVETDLSRRTITTPRRTNFPPICYIIEIDHGRVMKANTKIELASKLNSLKVNIDEVTLRNVDECKEIREKELNVVFTRKQLRKQEQVDYDLEGIASAILTYNAKHHHLPGQLDNLKEVDENINFKDPWGHEYKYNVDPSKMDQYELLSLGPPNSKPIILPNRLKSPNQENFTEE